MSKVQIVIPSINLWNSYTKPCIDSIKTKHDYRILLIDNKSDDETKTEASKLVSDKFCHHRNEERWSCAKSWNFGIKDAFERGYEYVFVINNDVILHPDCIDKLIERFEKAKHRFVVKRSPTEVVVLDASEVTPEAPVIDKKLESDVLAMVTALDARGESVEGPIERPDKMLSFNKDDVPETEHPCFSGFMINRAMWDKVGEVDEGFTPAYFEDNDYHYRINMAGMKAIVYPPAMFYHFGSKTQLAVPPSAESHRRFEANRQYFIGKWGGHPGQERFKVPFDNSQFSIKGTKQNNYV